MGSSQTASGTPPRVRLAYAKDAATALIASLDANGGVGTRHHVGVTSYGGTTATTNVALGTANAATVTAAINGINANGNTPLKTGMSSAAADMAAHERTTAYGMTVQHVLIFLSDGKPNPDPGQRPSAAEISAFRGAADEVYSVAIGQGGTGASAVDLTLMAALASPADADHTFHVITGSQLPDIFTRIYASISCSPGIAVAKSASTTLLPFGGGEVTYTYVVTNTGNVDLETVGVTDDKCSPVTLSDGDTGSDGILGLTETWTFTCTQTITENTLNVAEASAWYGDTKATASDDVLVTVAEPEITPTPDPTPPATPDPTPTEVVPTPTEPVPTPTEVVPTPTAAPSSSVAGETGRPHTTPPPTDAGVADGSTTSGTSLLLVLTVLAAGPCSRPRPPSVSAPPGSSAPGRCG